MCQSRFNNCQMLEFWRNWTLLDFFLFCSPLLLHVALASKNFNVDWLQIIIVYSSLQRAITAASFAFRFSNLFAIEMGQMTFFFCTNHHLPIWFHFSKISCTFLFRFEFFIHYCTWLYTRIHWTEFRYIHINIFISIQCGNVHNPLSIAIIGPHRRDYILRYFDYSSNTQFFLFSLLHSVRNFPFAWWIKMSGKR